MVHHQILRLGTTMRIKGMKLIMVIHTSTERTMTTMTMIRMPRITHLTSVLDYSDQPTRGIIYQVRSYLMDLLIPDHFTEYFLKEFQGVDVTDEQIKEKEKMFSPQIKSFSFQLS